MAPSDWNEIAELDNMSHAYSNRYPFAGFHFDCNLPLTDDARTIWSGVGKEVAEFYRTNELGLASLEATPITSDPISRSVFSRQVDRSLLKSWRHLAWI